MEDIIYEALETELISAAANTYLSSLGLKEVKTVALFNNQYRREQEEKAYRLPAVFVEFSTATYLPQGKNTEEVQDRIRIHIEQKNFATAQSNSHNKATALEVLKYINAIHKIIASKTIAGVGRPYRMGRELDTDHGNAPVHIFEYGIQYLDENTDRYGDYVDTAATATVAPTKQLVEEIKNPEKEADNPYTIDD